jgi:hypothetical protein
LFQKKTLPSGELKIFLSGSIGQDRGIPFLLNLLKTDSQAKVYAAGWLYDQAGKDFCQHPQVVYYGVVHQSEAAQIAKNVIIFYVYTNRIS